MKNQKLHDRTKFLADRIAESEVSLVGALIVVEQREAFRDFGYKGLFKYCMKYLGMTESVAENFRGVVRRAIELPELRKALESQDPAEKISVPVAGKIISSLTAENASEVLAYAATHSVRETENWLVQEKGVLRKSKMTIDSENLEWLKKIKDFSPGAPTNNQMLNKVLRHYYGRFSPVEKAKRSKAQSAKKNGDTPDCTEGKVFGGKTKRRKPLRAEEKHAVNLRDEHRCCYRDQEGNRCKETRWLATHHMHLVSEGGTNEVENLITLCPEHHDLVHQLSFPIDEQKAWIPVTDSGVLEFH